MAQVPALDLAPRRHRGFVGIRSSSSPEPGGPSKSARPAAAATAEPHAPSSARGEQRALRIIRRTWLAQRVPVSSLLDRFGSADNAAEIAAVRERTAGMGPVENALWGDVSSTGAGPGDGDDDDPPRRLHGASAARRARDHITIARLRGEEFTRHVREVHAQRRAKLGGKDVSCRGHAAMRCGWWLSSERRQLSDCNCNSNMSLRVIDYPWQHRGTAVGDAG